MSRALWFATGVAVGVWLARSSRRQPDDEVIDPLWRRVTLDPEVVGHASARWTPFGWQAEPVEPEPFNGLGFVEGRAMALREPWPLGWEAERRWERCAGVHPWERVYVHTPHRDVQRALEPVIRCAHCHVPRCGDTLDRDPCMLRRHHPEAHVPWSRWAIPAIDGPVDR